MTIDWEHIAQLIRETDVEVLKKAIDVDGHTIYHPDKFLEAGLGKEIVDAFTEEHQSGDEAKSTIFGNEGEQLDAVKGVYGLDLLIFIAQQFKVTSWKLGRGSAAAHLRQQLLEKWNKV